MSWPVGEVPVQVTEQQEYNSSPVQAQPGPAMAGTGNPAQQLAPVPVHIKADDTQHAPKQPPDDIVILTKSYQSVFYVQSAAGTTDPELILPHSRKRVRAVIRCIGTPFVSNPVPGQPAVPASTVAQQNISPYPVLVVLSGFTATAVIVNGITVGVTNGTYIVPSGGYIAVTYSVVGAWVWSNANGPNSGNSDVYLCETKGNAQQVNPQPQGARLGPGQDYVFFGNTELYLVAFGNGAAPFVSVVQEVK